MEAEKFFDETLAFVEDYHNKGTKEAILKAVDRMKVGAKGQGMQDLKLSVRTEVRQSGTTIIGETFFLTYGRFRDMGTGSGGRGAGKRRPAPFYSKPYYARLNALMGVVNVKVAETAAETVMSKLNDI